MELLPSLLSGLKAVCATFPDPRQGRGGNIGRADFGLSAFAMFFLQSASFLAFQRALEKGQGRSNCQTLFGIGKIPSDNYIRDMLDGADPALLQPCFERMEELLAAPLLRASFARLGDRILIAWDGTEYFCSQKLGCPHCLTRKRANGKVESYHILLAVTAVAPAIRSFSVIAVRHARSHGDQGLDWLIERVLALAKSRRQRLGSGTARIAAAQ